MSTYRVWCPERGASEVKIISGVSAQDAAEEWARQDDWHSAEYAIVGGREEPVVTVMAVDGEVTSWQLRGRSEPVYWAIKVEVQS